MEGYHPYRGYKRPHPSRHRRPAPGLWRVITPIGTTSNHTPRATGAQRLDLRRSAIRTPGGVGPTRRRRAHRTLRERVVLPWARIMRRTTVMLPDELLARLRHESRRRGTSVVEVVRGSRASSSGAGGAPGAVCAVKPFEEPVVGELPL